MIKRVLMAVLALVALLVAAVAVNTWRQGSRQVDVPPFALMAIDEKAAGESLAAAVRAKTVSSPTDAALNADQRGLYSVVQSMKQFAANPRDDASFWQPAPLLAKLAAEGKSFT